MKKLLGMMLVVVGSMAACAVDPIAGGSAGRDDSAGAVSEQTIIGGTRDTGDPSVVAICAHAPNSTLCSLCSGTVIGPRTVLTAAHCVDPSLVGANQVFEVMAGGAIALPGFAVSSTKFDPAFNVNNLFGGHDIGIVHTVNVLPFPLVLPATVDTNLPVTLVGYGVDGNGSPGLKRQVTTSIVTAETNSILIKDGNSNAQVCFGDSGGPAFQTINGQLRVVGVASFTAGGAPPSLCFGGGYHNRVDAYLPFITSEAVDPTDFMNWAEGVLPTIFPATQPNQFASPYTFRYYPSTQNYLGTANGRVYMAGPIVGNPASPIDYDALINYACSVYPASCPS